MPEEQVGAETLLMHSILSKKQPPGKKSCNNTRTKKSARRFAEFSLLPVTTLQTDLNASMLQAAWTAYVCIQPTSDFCYE